MKLLLVTFAGLPGTTLLLGFLGVATLTTLLYILRLRRRRVAVAFLALWERSLVERKASALRSRLQRLLSLLISLLLVGALILALGDPRGEGETDEGRSIAVLLDVSASMGDLSEGRPRLEIAKERVAHWLSSLGPGDEMLLVELGARPRPLAASTSDRGLLESSLKDVEVLDVSSDLAAGLRLVRDALRGRSRPQILLVSDGALPQLDAKDFPGLPPLFFESVAEVKTASTKNIGITSFSARRYPLSPDRFEVLVELSNAGPEPVEVEVSLFAANERGQKGEPLDLNRLVLPAEGSLAQSYDNLDQARSGLIVEVARTDGNADPFLRDNVARTLLAERVPAKVLVVGEPNNFLDAALLVEESLEVLRVSEANYPPAGKFDLTIFDGVFPPRSRDTGAALYLGAPPPEGGDYPVAVGEEIKLFGFDTWKEDSTVFRLIDPYNVQVLHGRALTLGSGDVALGSSGGQPILVRGERPEGAFLALGFSPRDSDFVLRTAWPLFVLNVIDELFPRGRTDAVLGLKTGTLWRPPVSTSRATVQVRGPLGDGEAEVRTVPLEDGRAVFFGERAGFYEALTEAGPVRFAGSMLSGVEGEVEAQVTYSLGEKPLPKVEGMSPRKSRQPWFWLLVGVLVVSFTEWWLYHRRWTV